MTKSRYRLQNDQEKEVAVRNFAKLHEEILREEGKTSVFSCSYQVVGEFSVDLIPIKDSIDLKYTSLFITFVFTFIFTDILTNNVNRTVNSIVPFLLCLWLLKFTVMPRTLRLFCRAL